MFLGAYHYDGDPARLLISYERLRAAMDDVELGLHICAAHDDGLVVLDACPTEAVFRAFSTSEEFADASAAAGLPPARIEALGTVHEAILAAPVRSGVAS